MGNLWWNLGFHFLCSMRMEVGVGMKKNSFHSLLQITPNLRYGRMGKIKSQSHLIFHCDPYFDDVGCSHPGCEPEYPTPKCVRKCVDGNQLWRESKHYSVNAYRISSDPDSIMAEVYMNGPVEVSFTVYEDFAHYKSGVYKHVTGGVMGGHAVRLIGWGTSADGEDYWLLANQWNKGWGDDGYFKIKRGINECGIEDEVVAGLPSNRNLVREVTSYDFLKDASL